METKGKIAVHVIRALTCTEGGAIGVICCGEFESVILYFLSIDGFDLVEVTNRLLRWHLHCQHQRP